MSNAALALARGLQARDPIAILQFERLDEAAETQPEARQFLRLVAQMGDAQRKAMWARLRESGIGHPIGQHDGTGHTTPHEHHVNWPEGLDHSIELPHLSRAGGLASTDHWHLRAEPKEHNNYHNKPERITIHVEPRLPSPEYRELPRDRLGGHQGFYDSRIATYTPSDEVYGRRVDLNPETELSDRPIGQDRPDILWRGISYHEMQHIRSTGQVQSRGEYNFDSQGGQTLFSTGIQHAESYANGFAPVQYVPSFDRPSYIIGIQRPNDSQIAPSKETLLSHEVGVLGPVSASDIVEVHEARPYFIRPGEQDLRLQWDGSYADSSGSPVRSSVGWRKLDPAEMFGHVAQANPSDVSAAERGAIFEHLLHPEPPVGHRIGAGHVGERIGREFRAEDHAGRPLHPAAGMIYHNLLQTAVLPHEHEARRAAWDHPNWQAHLAGIADVPVTEKRNANGTVTREAHTPWLPAAYARGTESKTRDEKGPDGRKLPGTIRFRAEGATGAWSQDELANEPYSHLYTAWLMHRGRMIDRGAIDAEVQRVDAVGLPDNDPRIIEGERHVMPAAELFEDLGPAEQQSVLDKMKRLGVTFQQLKDGMESWFQRAVKDEMGRLVGQHWYEGALVHLSAVANLFGLPMQVVGGIAAAHSPQTSWDRNRELTIRTVVLWHENPYIDVAQTTIDTARAQAQASHEEWTKQQRLRAVAEQRHPAILEREAKKPREKRRQGYEDLPATAPITKAYRDAQANLKLPIPADLTAGLHRVQDLPPVIAARSIQIGTTVNNTARALEILRRGSPDVLRGKQKISSFYNNNVAPHSHASGTVDIWQVRAAVFGLELHFEPDQPPRPMWWGGEEGVILTGANGAAIAQGLMPIIRQGMHENATLHDMPESSYQAVTWVAINNYFTGKGGVAKHISGPGHPQEYRTHFKSIDDFKKEVKGENE